MSQLILASRSASRRKLLENAGVAFTVESSSLDEGVMKSTMRFEKKTVEEAALALAIAKAKEISAKNPNDLVLGADQMLECEGKWLDKAESLEEAKDQLQFLSGKTHRLITAAVLLRSGVNKWQSVIEARMSMRKLSYDFIDDYCAKLGDEMLGTVGCYALEGMGSQLFDKVEGDFFGILGLPLFPLLQALRTQGILKT